MDPNTIAQILQILAMKPNRTGPEHMLYVALCENYEQWLRAQTKKLKEDNESSDDTKDGTPINPQRPSDGTDCQESGV